MTTVTDWRAMRALRQTPVILSGVLNGVTHDEATTLTEGEGGWTITEVICHLRDFEEVFMGRAKKIQNEVAPQIDVVDHLELVIQNDYQSQDFRTALAELIRLRREFIAFLDDLEAPEWFQYGAHPEAGHITILDVAMQTALHDVNHIEQIMRILNRAEPL